MSRTLSTFDLPVPIHNWSSHNVNPLISYKLDYDETAEQTSRDDIYGQLNDDQKYYFDTIVTAVDESFLTTHFFL